MSHTDYGDLVYQKRPVSSHCPMERGRRAKQFAPFDALKGFEEAVRAKETVYESKRIMAEDAMLRLNHRLGLLRQGDPVTVRYYVESQLFPGKGHYRTVTGRVKDIRQGSVPGAGELWISEQRIPFADVWDIIPESDPEDL